MALALIFDSVGIGEWFVLLAVLLVVVGPKRLPETARKIGRIYAKLGRIADGFRRQLMEADAEIERAARSADDTVAVALDPIEAQGNEKKADEGKAAEVVD